MGHVSQKIYQNPELYSMFLSHRNTLEITPFSCMTRGGEIPKIFLDFRLKLRYYKNVFFVFSYELDTA